MGVLSQHVEIRGLAFWPRNTYSLSLALLLVLSEAITASPPKPNLVIILTDDMGYSDLGCYGGEIRTPHLDALAANGLRFTQFYNTARCCPTRASLLTGLYPHQASVGHMMNDSGPEFPGYRGDLSASSRTIAEVLKPAGYAAYAVGKWHVTRHLGPDGPKHNWPLQRGFDRFYGTIQGAGSYFDPGTLTRDNTPISAYADAEYKPETYYYTHAIGDHAVRYIREHHAKDPNRPFVLYVAFTAAHWPMHALPQDIAKYKGRYDRGYEAVRQARFAKGCQLGVMEATWGLGPTVGDWNSVTNKAWEAACMEVYAAMVDCMDQNVGKIFDELKRTGRFDNTLIFYMQDNGGCAEPLGRNDKKKDHPNIQRPLRPTFPTMKPEDFQATTPVPKQTRDGFPIRMGPQVMPGEPDTYIAYGEAWANVSNTPFREYKHWVHEGGISTPLIAHWPKGITARGEIRSEPAHLIDILATCVELSGAKYPADAPPLEGVSLLPVFANRPLEREAIFFEHEGNRAIRMGDWKLVAKGPGSDWELYNIPADRGERKNLAAEQPERVRMMREKWEAWARRAQVLPWIWKPPYGLP